MSNHQRNPLEKAVTISGMTGHVHRNAHRSRTSGEYRVDFFMTPFSQEMESPEKPGRFSLLVTYHLQQVHPYFYLVDVLQPIDLHPASEVRLLIPWLWKERFSADPTHAQLELRLQ